MGQTVAEPPRLARAAGLVALTLAALAGNYLHATIFVGVDLLFGSIFALVAVHLYGTLAGMGVAALAGAYVFVLWHHWWAMLILVLEAGFVGLVARRRTARIPIADAAYWLCVGAPVIWLTYHGALGLDPRGTLLVFLKQSTNGILNALAATILLAYAPRPGWLGGAAPERIRIQDNLSHVIALTILVPALLLMVVSGRAEMSRIEEEVTHSLGMSGASLASRVRELRERYVRGLQVVATIADTSGALEGTPSAELQEETKLLLHLLPSLHNIYVADANARTVAFYPPENERGERTVGLSFADREYYKELVRTKQPVFSDAFQGRGGVFRPIATVSVPVVRGGELRGFALGAIDLDHLGDELRSVPSTSSVTATLVDRRGQVIASSQTALHPLEELLSPPARELEPAAGGTSLWLPSQVGMPMISRWNAAVYITEISAGIEPWRLVVEARVAPYLAVLQRRYTEQLAVLLGLCLAALVFAPLVARRLAAPLERLAAATTRFRNDVRTDDPQRWPNTRIAEIDSLVADFRAMQAGLREQVNAVEAANVELAARNEEARRAARAKDEFIAMLGHELRNPLGAMSNALHLLQRTGPAETVVRGRALEVLDRQLRHQTRLVNDLLDVSRASRGRLEIERHPLDLGRLVRDAAEDQRRALEESGLALDVALPEGATPVVGDRVRLAQVLSNLLHNAQKFTPPGGRVAVRLRRDEGHAVLEVEDTGTGIAPELLPEIFEPFTQGERALDRSQGGLGLGLALVSRILALHGGEVRAESDGPGRGARFTCTFPLARDVALPADARAPAASPAGGGGPIHVLLVEDNADVRESMQALLELAGHAVEVATDGPEGLERARARPHEVVLCDLGLPGLDGYEVAKALRREPTYARALLVAISGYGGEDDRRRSKAAGFDVHLTKPIDPEALERTLGALRSPGPEPVAGLS